MKLKFVSDDVVRSGGGRRSVYPWAEFIEELYKHPNRWAEFPMQVPHSAIAYRVREKYADIEVTITGGNNLSSDHPDKRYWTVYLAYTPKTGPQNGK
jgi:hypothetical protein